MKSYTDIEQSRKLAEILPIESADGFWEYHDKWCSEGDEWEGYEDYPRAEPYLEYTRKENEWKEDNSDVPCWSLAALMHMLPSEFTENGEYSKTTYNIRIRKYVLTVDVYQIAYGNYKFYKDGSSSWKDMINTGEKENLIDAAFDMICWLKENNKL